MKIKFIEKIKEFFEKRKLKKLPDEILREKVEQNIEGEETEKLEFMVSAIENEKERIEATKKAVESPDISVSTKVAIINELTHKNQVKLFKESIKSKELMAQKDVNTFVQIIINNKSLQPYDELYYRIDKAFSDSQLADILEKVKQERPETYDEEKVLRIVAKQMDINLKKYGTSFPSHAIEAGLFREIILKDEKAEKGKREFDILNPEDRQRLSDAMKEERDEIVEKSKNSMSKQESNRLTDEAIDAHIQKMLDFRMKRQKELNEQNEGKEI